MKNYHLYKKENIGASDVAALIFVGCDENGVKSIPVQFASDGTYSAYIVDSDADIGDHYQLVGSFFSWLRIYDDFGLTCQVDGNVIEVYRSGKMGCIIKIS